MATSHGTGRFDPAQLGALGDGCVLEEGVLCWYPETMSLGDGVYVGHRTMLKGDTRGTLTVGDGSWIGQDCFLHSAGSITIGRRTGVGPRVMMLTSTHEESAPPVPIMDAPLQFAPVVVGDGCDIGIGAILLPGAVVEDGAQIGAGAVVSGRIPANAVAAGVPAKVLRFRC